MVIASIKFKFFIILSIVILFSLIIFSNSGCTEKQNPISGIDTTTVFSKAVDTTKIIMVTTESGGKMKVAGNQILISVNAEEIDAEDIKSTIENTGGEIVGQIPNLGIYQVEYPFSTESELKNMKTILEANQEVELAAYNGFPMPQSRPNTKDHCEKNYDNHIVNPIAQVFYLDIGYYLAVPIMGLVREHMTLNSVSVAIADTEIDDATTQEFDNIIKSFPREDYEATQSDSHGTAVAGIIAADNFDGGINGITSSLIGDNLKITSVYTNYNNSTAMDGIVHIYLTLTSDKIDIYHMSYTYGKIDKDTGKPIRVGNQRVLFWKTIKYFPDVLFIAPAGNEHFELTINNQAPAGIGLDNVITVSGTQYAEPEKACTWTAFGPLIDISAQAEKVPLVDPTKANSTYLDDGTSFSSPVVTALAVILKSIQPSLTPGDIKKYILDYSYPTDTSIGGRRLYLPLPIEQLLIDMNAPAEILEKIDLSEPKGEWDLPGVVAARICNISTITIGGEPIMQCETSDTSNTGYISDNAGGGMIHFKIGTQHLMLGFFKKFKILNSSSDIVEYYPGIEDAITVSYSNANPNYLATGNATSGTISIKNGLITERWPGTGHPMVIEAEGLMSGTMDMVVAPYDIEPVNVDFNGTLMITIVMWDNESDAFYEYFEDNCD